MKRLHIVLLMFLALGIIFSLMFVFKPFSFATDCVKSTTCSLESTCESKCAEYRQEGYSCVVYEKLKADNSGYTYQACAKDVNDNLGSGGTYTCYYGVCEPWDDDWMTPAAQTKYASLASCEADCLKPVDCGSKGVWDPESQSCLCLNIPNRPNCDGELKWSNYPKCEWTCNNVSVQPGFPENNYLPYIIGGGIIAFSFIVVLLWRKK